VGTSAGAVAAGYLRSGWGTEDVWRLVMGTHDCLAGLTAAEIDALRAEMFTPRFRNAPELARRTVGSTFVLGRSVVRAPALSVPGWLQRWFPGGLFDMTAARRRFAIDLPDAWPARPLWLCTVDVANGKRVVLGRPGAPAADLRRAVLASCAIPGLYKPVTVGGRVLVDAGARSDTNLDLGVTEGVDLIVAVAPSTFDPSDPPARLTQLVRRVATRRLAAEARFARRAGCPVLLVRPSAADIGAQGLNFMRSTGWERVALQAYDTTARMLETPRFQEALAA
jgi:NTE family protein